MRKHTELKAGIELETKLRTLLDKYGYTFKSTINLFNPNTGFRSFATTRQTLRVLDSADHTKKLSSMAQLLILG